MECLCFRCLLWIIQLRLQMGHVSRSQQEIWMSWWEQPLDEPYKSLFEAWSILRPLLNSETLPLWRGEERRRGLADIPDLELSEGDGNSPEGLAEAEDGAWDFTPHPGPKPCPWYRNTEQIWHLKKSRSDVGTTLVSLMEHFHEGV